MASPDVACPYCNAPAQLHENSAQFYHGRDYGPVWACVPCGAWVGVHRNSRRHVPLGRLADMETRQARRAAHAVFDPLWQAVMRRDNIPKFEARGRAYKWLAGELQMSRLECHIAMFSAADCARVVEICTNIRRAA